MAEELFIPKFGQTVEEVTLVRWLVDDGQAVDHGQPVLDVETDKAIFSVEATEKGIIHIGPFKEGDVVPVVTVVAIIGKKEDKFVTKTETTNDVIPSLVEAGQEINGPVLEPTSASPDNYGGKYFASPRARKYAQEHQVDLSLVKASGGGGIRIVEGDVAAFLANRPKVTPVAQKIAQEAGISLEEVIGSGPGGRITRADVELLTRQAVMPTIQQEETRSVSADSIDMPVMVGEEVKERIPLRGVRSIIANRMAESVHSTARVTLLMEVDATAFTKLRENLKVRYAEMWGFSPGYNDLLVKILSSALCHYPYMNSRLTEDAIEILTSINIGIAVDTQRGLIVPVLRNADRMSLQQIGTEIHRLVKKAQEGTILPDEFSGGTFTLTNLGMFDVTAFTPVINLPEAAILGVGKIFPAIKLVNGQVVEHKKMVLSLVFDHRLVDGAPAARFLKFIKEMIEEPSFIAFL